jgi:murein L,D-transpeptidase YafK
MCVGAKSRPFGEIPMLLSLLGAAAILLAAPRDTANARSGVASPTVERTPVVRIRSRLIADSIVVEKWRRRLTLYQDGFPVGIYRIALGKEPVGDKLKIGDNRTPEGLFYIDAKNPQSKFHMALHISYPDAAHKARAKARGVKAGGDVMIHGLPSAFADLGKTHSQFDWTEGCIAVTNAEIEQIWRAIPYGAPIQIKP